jgi:hypothetical protein
MITNFKIFENKFPDIDKNTIRAENKEKGCYIDFYFNENVLIAVDNKCKFEFPFKLNIDLGENKFDIIRLWAYNFHNYSHTRFKVYYLLDEKAKKYNI